MRCARVSERDHRGNCLYRLSETHFVTQQHALLMQRIFHAPFLIATQFAQKTVREKALFLYFSRQLFRQTVNRVIRAENARIDILQRVEKANGIFRKIRPRRRTCFRLNIFKRREYLRRLAEIRALQQLAQRLISVDCLLLFQLRAKHPFQSARRRLQIFNGVFDFAAVIFNKLFDLGAVLPAASVF